MEQDENADTHPGRWPRSHLGIRSDGPCAGPPDHDGGREAFVGAWSNSTARFRAMVVSTLIEYGRLHVHEIAVGTSVAAAAGAGAGGRHCGRSQDPRGR